jgi:putative DNA primase/helicase
MPVLYDESEQNNDREKNRVEAILGLIRQASTESDALTLKGTAGGNAMNFHIRSMFCLASIQVGMKHQADVERLSVLALKPKGGETNASESWIKLRESLYNLHRDAMLPAKLLRRSLNLLPTTLRNIETFSQAAAEIFNSQRDGDQYGTLMAGCWSVVSEAVATKDDALAMIRAYDWSDHRENNDTDEGQRALGTLMEAHVRPGGGVDLTVNELVCAAAGQPTTAVDISADKANALLQRYGMKINGERLLLSTNSKELDRLIAGTQFQADLHGMLRRLPGANNFAGKPMRFSGVQSKCTSLPLDLVMNLGWSWEDDQPPL